MIEAGSAVRHFYSTFAGSFARRGAAALLLACLAGAYAAPAHALSEIKREEGISEIRREELPAPPGTGAVANPEMPSNSIVGPADEPGDQGEGGEDAARLPDPSAPPPPVQYDLSTLPEPVRRMQGKLVEAAKSGDIEKLRPLLSGGARATQLTLGDDSGDPIDLLRSLSGDGEGHEILAILEEVLEAGFVHLDEGTSEELYVWPYFFALPLDGLTPQQRVELFKLVTAGDYEEMKTYGTYVFYRVGITPEGEWVFFVSGD
jgi:hypothetical protein